MLRVLKAVCSNAAGTCILIYMNRKLVFFDIDGTLTDPEGRIPASAVKAIHAARENGVLCVINTGRPYSHIVPSVRETGFDGYICSCGQHVLLNGETVFRHSADRAFTQKIIEAASRCRADLFGEAEEGVWSLFAHTPGGYMLRETERFKARGMRVFTSPEEGDPVFDKFCVWFREDGDRERFVRAVSERYYPAGLNKSELEFVLNGHSKQSGGEAFLKLTGVDPGDVYAIGDGVNDLPVFRLAAHTAAMANGAPELLAISEFVTGDLYTDGVEQALSRFGLI